MVRILIFTLLVVPWAPASLGFDPAPLRAAEPAAGSAPAAPVRTQALAGAFQQWKDLLAQLKQLQDEHQVANRADQPSIEKQYEERIAEGRKLAPQLEQLARESFAAAPNQDPEVSEFLVARTSEYLRNEQYEEAESSAAFLIKHGIDDKVVYAMAGVADFYLDQYEDAVRWLEKAKDDSVLEGRGTQLLDEAKVRAAEAKADDLPRVKLTTSKGDIVVELFENEAPIATANFINLVEDGFYDGLTFHRVIPGFVAQGGDPKGDGTGGPGYTIRCECYGPDFRRHYRGSLSMAHAGRDTGGSQFFLTLGDTPHLNGMHTVFGRVIEGRDVLMNLQHTENVPTPHPPVDKILKAEVLRKRNHEYVVPEKLPSRK